MFKGAAIRAAAAEETFQEFYAALLAKGMKPRMARLTLAQDRSHHHFDRLEERSAFRRRTSETTSSLSISSRVHPIAVFIAGVGLSVLRDALVRG
jgi:hypothetical protein